MTAKSMILKRRPTNATLHISLAQVTALMTVDENNTEEQAKDNLWNAFKAFGKDDTKIHDKVQLQTIVDFVPEGGLAMTEIAKWFKLAKRVEELDDTREGPFTLSDFQVDLIWKRLNDSKFLIRRLDPSMVMFVLDFQAAFEKHFTDEDPWKDEEEAEQ